MSVVPPAASITAPTFNNGYSEIRLQGVEGIKYMIQVLSGLGGDNRWVNVKTVTIGNDEIWIDMEGILASRRFYRLVWVQPPS